MTWKIPSVKVLKVEERKTSIWTSGVGSEAVFGGKSLGFFAQFEGSYESLFLGHEKPNLKPGDTVDITITRKDGS